MTSKDKPTSPFWQDRIPDAWWTVIAFAMLFVIVAWAAALIVLIVTRGAM